MTANSLEFDAFRVWNSEVTLGIFCFALSMLLRRRGFSSSLVSDETFLGCELLSTGIRFGVTYERRKTVAPRGPNCLVYILVPASG